MLRESFNKVVVEGQLVELESRQDDTTIDLDSGKTVPCKYVAITAHIDAGDGNIVPIDAYSKSTTKAGKENKVYKSLMTVLDTYQSRGVAGDRGDFIKVTGGSLEENLFVGDDGSTVSGPKIRSNFFNRATGEISPKSQFTLELCIISMEPEVTFSGEETGSLVITGGVVGYAGKINLLKFHVDNQQGVQFFEKNCSPGDTVKVGGEAVFKTEKTVIEIDSEDIGFGEPLKDERERKVKRFVITTSSKPYDEDEAFNTDLVKQGLVNRESFIEQKKAEKSGPAKPAQGFGGFGGAAPRKF